MKRTKEQQLEYESELLFRQFLPREWIVRKLDPDYGVDLEIDIVEGEAVTNQTLKVQLKATEKLENRRPPIYYSFKTKHLKYYEDSPIPIVIILWDKSGNQFYYLFAQQYIWEVLTSEDPLWREKKTKNISFSDNSRLENSDILKSIAKDGILYIFQKRIIGNYEPGSAIYWLDGIPKSDNKREACLCSGHCQSSPARHPE